MPLRTFTDSNARNYLTWRSRFVPLSLRFSVDPEDLSIAWSTSPCARYAPRACLFQARAGLVTSGSPLTFDSLRRFLHSSTDLFFTRQLRAWSGRYECYLPKSAAEVELLNKIIRGTESNRQIEGSLNWYEIDTPERGC